MKAEETARIWLGKLTKLNPAIGRGDCSGKAPHKPLLLLCLLDMAEAGELKSRAITRSPGLVLRFRSYGSLVTERWSTRLDLRLPFFHLHTQGFWEALDSEMRIAGSAETCTLIELNPAFYDLLCDPAFRVKARIIIITKYFSVAEQVAFFACLGIEGNIVSSGKSNPITEEAEKAAQRKGRSSGFAVRVCSEYRFVCALTGYQCTANEGVSIVEAAHIEQWAKTRNDDPVNGLALSKNAHWMFDNGLWSADGNLRILVNTQRFIEHGPEFLKLAGFAGRHLQIPPSSKLRPSQECLRQHRLRYGFHG